LDGFTEEEVDDIIADLPGGQSVSPAMRRLHEQLRTRRRHASHPAPTLPGLDDGVLYAPAQSVRPMPVEVPHVWWILRKRDDTGISGVGVIGVCFMAPDGAAAYRWFGGPPQNQPKWEFYDNPGTAPFEQISGHSGNTVLIPVKLEPED
jgi:hypothetical protein